MTDARQRTPLRRSLVIIFVTYLPNVVASTWRWHALLRAQDVYFPRRH
jgi:hypothetical protein